MKTTVGKVLSVVTAVGSVVFLGFVTVAIFGGPNWIAEAQQIEGYSFSQTTGPEPQWKAARHVGEASLSQNKVIEPVIVAVYDDKVRTEGEELQALKDRVAPLQERIRVSQESIDRDLAALAVQVDAYEQLLVSMRNQTQATAEQVELKAQAVRRLEQTIQSRREDVLRIRAQVEEMRVDRFRLHEIQRQLEDLIQQIDGSLDRAQRRQRQLTPYAPQPDA